MNDKRPSGLIAIAPIVFSLLVGGIAGYFVRYYSNVGMPTTPGAKGGSPPGGLTAPGAGGGMGGGGGGGQQSSSASLVRLVRNLGTIEKVQNKGLTSDQMSKALPILQEIQSADKLPEADCKTKLDALEGVLTADQKQALQDLTPQRGGGGGGRGGGGGGMGGGMPGMGSPGGMSGGPGGMPGSGGMPMGGGPGGMPGSGGGGMGGGAGRGGGGGQDPDRPFASDRNKQALQDLIGALKH